MGNKQIPHLYVVIKNWEGYLSCGDPVRSKGSQPHTRLPNREHKYQEEESPEHQVVKISVDWIWIRRRAAVDPFGS